MNVVSKQQDPSLLYEADLNLWSAQQEQALAARRLAEIDWVNVAEEIASVGRAERREIRQWLMRLYQHLLKWEYQPQRRCNSWQSAISAQRIAIKAVINTSPSLRSFPSEIAEEAYEAARREACRETGLPLGAFPEALRYSAEEALDGDFMPGEPWTPDSLIRD